MKMPKKALVVGATGLIGEQLVDLIANSDLYNQVIVISRREYKVESDKVLVQIVDFENLDIEASYWNVDDVFCCLGTTMKKAGSKEAFKKVDLDYPIKIAQVTKAKGANSYHLISALGADAKSSVFYNRIKGQAEDAIAQISFDRYHIYQPSLLYGNRQEFRLGEKVGIILFKALNFLMLGPLKKYRGIESTKVAKAMLSFASTEQKGHFIHSSDELQNY